jgi:PQQ-dependent dehydrogenase (methanol/ethanol family)
MNRVSMGVVASILLSYGGAAAAQVPGDAPPVTDTMLANPDPAHWLMWRGTQNAWAYSPLDQIDRENVSSLRLVWSRPLNSGPQEGTPLVYGDIMYVPHPSDIVQALDATSGDLIWEHRRQWPADLLDSDIRFPHLKRNIAIYERMIIGASGDIFIYALDLDSGELVWETPVLDYRTQPAQQSSGPIIAGGRVISGRNCGSEGGPETCIIVAHDARTGRELWRTRTIPAPGEPGDETWGDVPFEERWHVGTWMPPSYDPELDLIYIGTSVTSPAPKFMLGSNDREYLFHNSTLALDPETGRIRWHYQHVVDHWDMDHPFERILVDTAVAPNPEEVSWINPNIQPGSMRRVLTGIPGKTGIVYTLDRETGEFLWARPTVAQNIVENIDGATGVVTVNPETLFTAAGQQRTVCPSLNGGKNWQSGAYSPRTHLMYMPLQNTCMTVTALHERPTLESRYSIATRVYVAPDSDNVGTLQAISVESGELAWKHEQRAGMMSVLTSGGGLVFAGDVNGRFRAFDDSTGTIRWEVNLGAPVTGFPVTYAVGGKQYLAISTGSAPITASLLSLAPELRPGSGNTLFVFALPD